MNVQDMTDDTIYAASVHASDTITGRDSDGAPVAGQVTAIEAWQETGRRMQVNGRWHPFAYGAMVDLLAVGSKVEDEGA